jgi:hypothetical protein
MLNLAEMLILKKKTGEMPPRLMQPHFVTKHLRTAVVKVVFQYPNKRDDFACAWAAKVYNRINRPAPILVQLTP